MRFARLLPVIAAVGVSLAVVSPAVAQKDDAAEADRLEKKVEQLSDDDELEPALAAARRVLAIREKVLPPGDARIGAACADLGALVLEARGDVLEAEKLLDRAVAITEKARDDKRHAHALYTKAWLLVRKGQGAEGRRLVDRAVELQEKAAGANDPMLGVYLRGQSRFASDRKQAEALLERARAIHDNANKPRESIRDLLALQNLYRANGLATQQQKVIGEVHKKLEAAYPKGKPSIPRATFLLTLSEANRSGDERWRDIGADQCAEALAIVEKLRGPSSPATADALGACALAEAARGEMGKSVALRARANDAEDRYLKLLLAAGTEQEKRAFADRVDRETETTVSTAMWSYYRNKATEAEDRKAAQRLALTTILRRKGRVLDALSGSLATLRSHLSADDRALLDELGKARTALAAAVVRGRGDEEPEAWLARVGSLDKQVRELETAVSGKSATLAGEERPVTIEAVQSKLPPGAALVEIYRYRVIDPRSYNDSGRWKDARYLVFVVPREGDFVMMELSLNASGVDTVVGQFRKVIGNPDAKARDIGDVTGRLYSITFGRFADTFKRMGVKDLYLSPDGALNLVPFGAFLAGPDHFLIEDMSLTYLSSGRDLLRAPAPKTSEPPLLVVAPDYDAGGEAASPGGAAGGSRGGDLSRAKFPPLAGTKAEGEAIRPMLRDVKVLAAQGATEAAVKATHAPVILHVATHGFFLSSGAGGAAGSRGLELDAPPAAGTPSPKEAPPAAGPAKPQPRYQITDPLLRSGLALAGANVRRGGADDGILTALEASNLDLHGTRLVVLSACETGLGDVGSSGEGVYGLRRALVVAGSETQVMSLWKVDDQATKDLMIDFYGRLAAGEGRAEALRHAQIAMLKKPGTHMPYYWAAFILSGASTPIEGVLSPPGGASGGGKGAPGGADGASGAAPGKVTPGARGCGCGTTEGELGGASALAVAVLFAAARRRRRG